MAPFALLWKEIGGMAENLWFSSIIFELGGFGGDKTKIWNC